MKATFTIHNPSEYYEHLLIKQVDEFMTEGNYNSSRHAILCSILAYHLREWIWSCNKEAVKDFLLNIGVIEKSKSKNNDYVECKFNEYINSKCPEFRLIREICNGSKHFCLREENQLKDTYKREGGYNGAFNGNMFGTDDLIIKDKNNHDIVFKTVLKTVVDYLKDLICELKI